MLGTSRAPLPFAVSALLAISLLACGVTEEGSAENDAPVPVEPNGSATPETPSRGPGVVDAEDGTPIAYTAYGAGETSIVFVHGWACDQTYWREQTDGALADRYRLVTIDLPGHGDSGVDRNEWTISGYGNDVAAVVEHLGLERVVLVGHSMGGAVILETADRLGARVVGLVPVDSLHNVEASMPDEQWQAFLTAYREDYAGSCATMVAGMFPQPGELADRIQADMCSGPEEVGLALLEQFAQYDSAKAMGRVGAPIHAINAEYSLPTQIETNRKHSPTFDATVQAGVGHFLMLEAPDRFEELLVGTVERLDTRTAASE